MALSGSANRLPHLAVVMNAMPVAMGLSGVQALIALIGLRRTAAAIWWLVDRLPPSPPAAVEPFALAEARARGIASIADRLPSRPRCLPRALLLSGILRRRRIGADLCLGARMDGGFDAHAWIEIGGRPVHEADNLQAIYSCLVRDSVLVSRAGEAHVSLLF